jgi:hypothetical protein
MYQQQRVPPCHVIAGKNHRLLLQERTKVIEPSETHVKELPAQTARHIGASEA